jgi:glutamate dehydrogenase/leucine dehydrogenase
MIARIQTSSEKIRGMLSAEIKFVIGIVVFVFGVATPYYEMKENIALIKNDIANINSNHEVHIQDLTQAIKDIEVDQKTQNDAIIELQKAIIRISK